MPAGHGYPALSKSDKELLADIFSILTDRVKADAYAEDGSYAATISDLPKGLRAIAATHHLDISLTLDDIGWHFLNFGEPNLVRETEVGLRELELSDLADWFTEAHTIIEPYLEAIKSGAVESPGDNYYDWLEQSGYKQRMNTLAQFAWDKGKGCTEDANGSPLYESWIRYARLKPEEVFADYS